jgi:hypothetical protein
MVSIGLEEQVRLYKVLSRTSHHTNKLTHNSLPVSKKTHDPSITKISQLILFKEIICLFWVT